MGNRTPVLVHTMMKFKTKARSQKSKCTWESICLAFTLAILLILLLPLGVLCLLADTDVPEPGTVVSFDEVKRKSKLHRPESAHQDDLTNGQRRTSQRFEHKKPGWKLNFLPTLILLPSAMLGNALGLHWSFMRRRLAETETVTEVRDPDMFEVTKPVTSSFGLWLVLLFVSVAACLMMSILWKFDGEASPSAAEVQDLESISVVPVEA